METTLEVEKAGFDGDPRKSSSTYYLCAQDICAAVGELDERSGGILHMADALAANDSGHSNSNLDTP